MDRLIKISDGRVELGVIPDLGGVVALLRTVGTHNILKADPSLWDKPPAVRDSFGADPEWEAYNGHIVWLGPQSGWWTQQTVNRQKLKARDVWPPDPYINHGNFSVTGRGDDRITMQGPDSIFSGVRLVKSIRIKSGKVHFTVTAQNIRSTPVSWDLWLNTRVDGYARCYAPVTPDSKVRIDGRTDGTADMTAFSYDKGYIRIDPKAPTQGKKKRWAKAFIPASKGAMAAFTSGQALVIRFKKHAPKLIHPEQALVEFYNLTTHDKNEALTELEYHAPYTMLEPGESMTASQTWEVYPFTKPTHQKCVDFLDEVL